MDRDKDRLPSEYAVKLKASALEDKAHPENQIAAVLDALEPLIVHVPVAVTIKDVTSGEEATHAEGAAPGRKYVPIHLAETRSTEAVRQALFREILKIKPGETLRRTCALPVSTGTPVPTSAATWPSTGAIAISRRSQTRRRPTCG